MLALVPSGRQRYPLERYRTLQRHLERRLLDDVSVPFRQGPRRAGSVAEVALDLGYAVVGRQQPFPEQALQHRPHARPVHQLQHEEM